MVEGRVPETEAVVACGFRSDWIVYLDMSFGYSIIVFILIVIISIQN